MKRIAFFGGSFDPPHRGHLAIAKAAADQFALDEILFAPVAHQPLKDAQAATTFLHRYAMTALATAIDARFVPSLLDAPREPGRTQPNYTAETLARLRDSLKNSEVRTTLYMLLGADSWLDIARWRESTLLLSLTDWIVAARPGFSLSSAERALPPRLKAQQAESPSGPILILHHEDDTTTRVHFLRSVWEDISATELRAALEAGRADSELLPAAVWEYIRKTGLYKTRVAQVSHLRPE